MKSSFLVIFIFFTIGFARGQNAAVSILRGSLNKIESLKSIEYQQRFIYTNPLSKGDTSVGQKKVSAVFGSKGWVTALNETTTLRNGRGRYAVILKGDTLYSVDYADSIYSADKTRAGDVTSDMDQLTDLIKKGIKEPAILIQKKDTVINRQPGFSFMLKTYDKMEAGHHSYSYNYLVIDKKTLMPVYTRENSAGVLEKGGYVIGRVELFKEENFSDYHINQKVDNSLFAFDRSNFGLKNNTMLADGGLAPALSPMDLNNRMVLPSAFKNKVVLVEFGATDCPANALANPMLNSLHEKYASNQFAVACIYTGEDSEKIKKYIAANNIKFPLYLGNKRLKNAFKTIAVPNFYLIDKNGRVIKGFNGYSDKLAVELSQLIEANIK